MSNQKPWFNPSDPKAIDKKPLLSAIKKLEKHRDELLEEVNEIAEILQNLYSLAIPDDKTPF